MNDTLLGVVVGGLIGWIAPLLTLRYGERRWRFEAKLANLKSERDRFESLYERTLKSLSEDADKGVYSTETLADIIVLMPPEVFVTFKMYSDESAAAALTRRERYLELVAAMKRDLKQRDNAISSLLSEA